MRQPLSVTHSKLVEEWHPTKNGGLTPDQVVAGTEKKVWWKCPEGPDHEWEATVASRARLGSGCPYCSGRKPSVTNRLDVFYPGLAKEWHPTKNGDLTPDQVVAGSNKKVWWECSQNTDHEWEAPVARRTRRGSGCPYCSGRKASGTNSLAALFPGIAAQWHPTKNGDLTPEQVKGGSHQKVWWQCPKTPDHEWEETVKNRTRAGHGCPYCSGRKVSHTTSLATLFPDIAANRGY